MSIYIAHTRSTSNALNTVILVEENVLSVRLNVNSVQPESLSWSGSKFQTVGPATENARQPNVLRRCRGTVSWQRLAERISNSYINLQFTVILTCSNLKQ